MICSVCNKNPATIHIQEIVNGVKKAIHLCQDCAAAKGLNIPGLEGMKLADFLKNMSSGSNSLKPLQNPMIPDSAIKTVNIFVCPKCGWDSEKMKKTGKLGCPECYYSFKDNLMYSLSVMHRGSIHCGKIPSAVENGRNVIMANLLKLQKELENHIKNEEYEEAAKVRDKLKDLKTEGLKKNEQH